MLDQRGGAAGYGAVVAAGSIGTTVSASHGNYQPYTCWDNGDLNARSRLLTHCFFDCL